MILGTGRQDVFRAGLVGGVLGALAFFGGLAVVWWSGKRGNIAWDELARFAIPCVAVAVILPALLGTASLLRVRLSDGSLAQLVGPCVVIEKPSAELERIDLRGHLFPVVFVFQDGTRMRLFGIPLRKRAAMIAAIAARVPGVIVEA
jgi:hypothetical protein